MSKSMFICQNCGAVLKKWAGQCPECHEWNTITEEKEEGGLITHNEATGKIKKEDGTLLNFESLDKEIKECPREIIGIGELDRVLGGGLVKGSAVLIGGDPGIGKSTLLLQTLCALANNGVNCMYISGEESTNQVRIRADRLGLKKAPIKLASATSVNDILKSIGVISESYQFMSHAGSVRGLVATMNCLMWFGNTTILLMAGMMGIDPALFEAAQVDGATATQIFYKITLPLLKPILIYVMITSLIGGLQMFDVPQILTNKTGDPMRTSMTLIMYLNRNLSVGSRNYGFAGALSVFMFILTGILSFIVFKVTGKEDKDGR